MSSAPVLRACVVGWPVEHSRSPLIHSYWLKHYGIAGSYDRKAVAPGELAGFLDAFQGLGYIGCNITLPHKESAFTLVDVYDLTTQQIAAVNTVYRQGERLVGINTDAYGFTAHLRASLPGWKFEAARVVVIGAGGAARAIIAALLAEGVSSVTVCNRTFERAAALAEHFGASVTSGAWPITAERLAECDLLVNTTSLGMSGQPPLDLSIASLPPATPVADIVYAPLETDLLKQARAAGHPVIDGLGMLLHQAVPGFELWFGHRPEVTPELRQLIESDLGGR